MSRHVPKASGHVPDKYPNIEEIKLFCAKSGIADSDAVWFFHHVEGNGWKNNGKPIIRWKSTLMAPGRRNMAGYLPSMKNGQLKRKTGIPNV